MYNKYSEYFLLAPTNTCFYNFEGSSNVNKPLPFFRSSCQTHPVLPTISFAPLAICRNVFSSPWLAKKRLLLLFKRPTMWPISGVPSRLNSTVYVCGEISTNHQGPKSQECIFTSTIASPFASSSVSGASTSVMTSGSGLCSGYVPVLLSCVDSTMTY